MSVFFVDECLDNIGQAGAWRRVFLEGCIINAKRFAQGIKGLHGGGGNEGDEVGGCFDEAYVVVFGDANPFGVRDWLKDGA